MKRFIILLVLLLIASGAPAGALTGSNYSHVVLKDGPGFVDVREYGAKGDGVTDDTVAIQTAINTGKKVVIPQGDYAVSSLFVPDGGVEIVGMGQYLTTLQSSSPAPIISKASSSVDTPYVNIRDIKLWQTGSGASYTVYLPGDSVAPYTGPRYSHWENVYILATQTEGLFIQRCWNATFRNVRIYAGLRALEVDNGCNNITFDRCVINGASVALATESIRMLGSPYEHHQILFDGCTIEGNAARAMWAYKVFNLGFRNCYFESATPGPEYQFRLELCPSYIFDGNFISVKSGMARFADILTTGGSTSQEAGRGKWASNVFQGTVATQSLLLDAYSEARQNYFIEPTNTSDGMLFPNERLQRVGFLATLSTPTVALAATETKLLFDTPVFNFGGEQFAGPFNATDSLASFSQSDRILFPGAGSASQSKNLYFISAGAFVPGVATSTCLNLIIKQNGADVALYKRTAAAKEDITIHVNAIVGAGPTNYFEVFLFNSDSSSYSVSSSTLTFFSGFKIQ